jgi:energy-coupling factor transport system substrate-specific component
MTEYRGAGLVARRVLVIGLGAGLVHLGWRVAWQFLSPLAAIGLRELAYGVWLVAPLLGALVTRRPGGALGVAALAALVEWVGLGTAPIIARLLAGLVAEGACLGRPSLGRLALLGALAAVVTLIFDPPAGVSALGWTTAVAAPARGLSGALVGGGVAWWVGKRLMIKD